MRQRTLRKPDGIKPGQENGPEGNRGHTDQSGRKPPHAQQRERRYHQHSLARHLRIVATELPPQRKINAWQRRVRIGQSRRRNQRAGPKKVPRGGNVVARFIPVVRQPQQGEVAGIQHHKDDRKNHPYGQRPVQPRVQNSFQAQRIAPRPDTECSLALGANPISLFLPVLTNFSLLKSFYVNARARMMLVKASIETGTVP